MATVYLAYQFGPEQLTEERFVRIIDDYFQFPESSPFVNGNQFLKFVESEVERYRGLSDPHAEEIIREIGNNLLARATYFRHCDYVKNHPLLEIRFIMGGSKSNLVPSEDFEGLNIHSHHSGSEGFVDLIGFKPEMDAFLSSIGINYEDRSRTSLD